MRLLLYCCILLQPVILFGQEGLKFQSILIDEALKNNANSILRNEKLEVTIPNQRSIEFDNYRVVTVLNKKGNSDVDAYAHYDEETRIKKIEATIYDKFGKEIKSYKKSDFKDVSAVSGGTLFSDSRVKYLEYTPTSYPYTVEYHYTTVSTNTAFIPGWVPNGSYNASTEKSSYTINYNQDELTLKYKVMNSSDEIKIQESPGQIKVSIENYEALVREAYSPGFENISPKVLFGLDKFHLAGVDGDAKDWESFGMWINNYLLSGTQEVPEETKMEVLRLVEGETDTVEKARKIYEYVQDKTRYISVQVGIGGWKPMLASEVDALGYGDCKALTNYTKSLLDVAEIPSYYTVLYAGKEKKDMQPDFTSMQGNHAILSIPNDDDYIWLECTSQEIPFGFIGDFTDDRDVVIITPEGGKIVHTDVYDYHENTQDLKGDYVIALDGSIEAQVEMSSKGIQYDDRYLVENHIEKDQKDYYYDFWDYINNMEIQSIVVENNKNEVILTEKVMFKADNYASFAGDEMLVSLNAFNRSTYIPKRYRNRKYDVRIDRGFVDIDSVRIAIPKEYGLPESIEDIHVESEFGTYDVKYTLGQDNTITYNRKYIFKDGEFPKEKYNDFRKFLKTIARYDSQKIVLTKIE